MLNKKELEVLITNTKTVADGTHFASLLGERKAGSKWGGMWTEDDFYNRSWCEFEPAVGVKMSGCHYYKCDILQSFPNATVGAIPLDDANRQGMLVKVAQGTHGAELQSESILEVKTDEATMIVGDEGGKQVIYTIHPGQPLASLPKGYDNSCPTKLNPMTAVKLV